MVEFPRTKERFLTVLVLTSERWFRTYLEDTMLLGSHVATSFFLENE